MKAIFILTILTTIALKADPRGSLHDAWSDWILDQKEKIEPEDEIVDNSEQDPDEDGIED